MTPPVGGVRAVLACDGVASRLGGVAVLQAIDLEVGAGEVVGLIGPSGAGKSTLFAVLAGELRPDAGRVWLGGREVTSEPLWRRARAGLGWVPQTPSVLLDLDVADNLRTFERAARVAPRPPHERAAELGLAGALGTRARSLSGGERRRLELLRALVAAPKALLCDEPLAGLDGALAALVLRRLRREAEAGAAVVIADHRLTELLPACDRVLRLVGGRLEAADTVESVAADPGRRAAYEA
ncbi:MAG: ABC transporter ATP-binding protein [Polyangiaceae bacterium]|nr:ABC transporter ATP-binding protein [Polyangiaceae bacterium]